MKFKETEPTLYVYAPNRTTLYGCTPLPNKLSINYRFNTFSEMSFEIRKYYYDERKEEWVKNPLYDKIEKNNLIKIPNDNPVFKYKVNELYDDDEYDLPRNNDGTPDYSQQPNRVKTAPNTVSAFFYDAKINHCTLQKETELFDVGSRDGYGWQWYGILAVNTDGNGNIEPSISGYYKKHTDIAYIMNESYFPVQVGDIIVTGCQIDSNGYYTKGANRYQYGFCPFFYSKADSAHCTHIGQRSDLTNNSANNIDTPIGRRRIKNGDLGSYQYSANGTRQKYIQEGFVRFKGIDDADRSEGFWYTPHVNRIKILSGERRCSSISTKNSITTLEYGIPWWVIVSVEKKEDGINSVKEVTVYSYEYTLSNRTFSIDDDTLPLYIPDNIPKVVTSDEFPIDKWSLKHPDDETATAAEKISTTWCGAQRMKRGLLNQLLDNLAGWKVRYISSTTCTRYRQIEAVDNANIYTFLMNVVQSKYQCFIFFDVENLYINIIAYTNMVGYSPAIDKSNVRIDWRNALKYMTIKNVDDNYATALRVHSEEDTYGLGLVNPNGSNVIYNFQNVKNELDYVVDQNHLDSNNTPYTLKQRIEKYETDITTATATYRGYAKQLIAYNKQITEYEVRLNDKLIEYQKAVDKNNLTVELKYNFKGGLPEIPPLAEEFASGGKWYWESSYPHSTSHHTETHNGSQVEVKDFWASIQTWEEVKKLAENYWSIYNTYIDCQSNIAKNIYLMKQSALKFSLNIKVLNEQFALNNNNGVPTNGYVPIFTPTEATVLFKYIYEADWTNENVVFNEKYSADDIYNTLVDLYNTANSEMDKIYSKPTFDFESDVANITRMPEMKGRSESLYLGSSLLINSEEKWVEPLLLEIKFDYNNFNSSPMVFTTDYNRKPKEMRFYELFSTIQQTSVETPTFTFDN